MYMFGDLTLQIAPGNIIWPIIISGFAITCIFVPMTTFSLATVSRENMGEATGLTNLLRNLGGSVGISAITTLVSRSAQTHQALLVGCSVSPRAGTPIISLGRLFAVLLAACGRWIW